MEKAVPATGSAEMAKAMDLAYQTIREAIVSGRFAAGAVLREKVLAADIGVSRTPIREALRRLEAEGLIEGGRYKRARVAELSKDDIEEIFDLRAVLEAQSALKAAQRLTSDDIARLKQLATAMETVVAARDPRVAQLFADLNNDFHNVILEASGGKRLKKMLAGIIDMPVTLLRHYEDDLIEHLEQSCQHHVELIKAFEAGDGERAALQMRLHMLAAKPSRYPA